MSPCGGECRVGRTLLRGGPSSPARGADPRRQQTSAVGCRAAADHCHTQRRTGGWRSSRTPQVDLACSSLSTALRGRQPQQQHQQRSPRTGFPRKRISRKRIGDGGQQAAPAGRSDRGSLRCPDFHEKEFAGSARPSRARGFGASLVNRGPKLLIVQCRLFGDDPVAEPRCAAGSRRSNSSSIDVAVWRRVSCWSYAAARWPVVAGARR